MPNYRDIRQRNTYTSWKIKWLSAIIQDVLLYTGILLFSTRHISAHCMLITYGVTTVPGRHVVSDRITLPRSSIDMLFQIPVYLNPIWNPENIQVSSCFVLPEYILSHLRGRPWAKSSLWSPCIHLDQNTVNSKNCWVGFLECWIHCWDSSTMKAYHLCTMFGMNFLGEACISESI